MYLFSKLNIRRTFATGLLFFLAGIGTGCTNLSTIESVHAAGKTFHDYLYADYRDLALYEGRQMYDTADSEYFALKARMAFEGGYVEPTLLRERSLSQTAREELSLARSDLMQALQGRMGQPENWKLLAKAQVQFDCWVEEQEENRQPTRIASCRDGFRSALTALKEGHKEPVNDMPGMQCPYHMK